MRAEVVLAATAVEVIVADVVQRLLAAQVQRKQADSPWVSRWVEAAGYLGLALSTLKHAAHVPRTKTGGLVLFPDKLDAWAEACFEGPLRLRKDSIAKQTAENDQA